MKYLEDEKLSELTAALSGATVGHSRVVNGRIEAYTMKRAGSDKKYAQVLGERYVQTLQGMEEQLSSQQHFQKVHRKRSQSAGLFEEAASKRPKAGRSRASSFDATVSKHPKASAATATATTTAPTVSLASALGDFTEQGTRRLMTDLILTLNASFPDYDFGDIQPDDFQKSSVTATVKRINERLSELPQVLTQLWTSVDSVIHLKDCDVYSYVPQPSHQDDSFLLQLKQQDDNMEMEYDDSVVLWSFNYFFVNKHLKRVVLFTCIESMRHEETVEETEQEEYNVYASADSADMDFDLDPSSATAGGIPISTV